MMFDLYCVRRKGGGTSPQKGGSNLEAEYITNLQQQVHFLELELKYYREADDGGEALPETVNAGPPAGAPSSSTVQSSSKIGLFGGSRFVFHESYMSDNLTEECTVVRYKPVLPSTRQ